MEKTVPAESNEDLRRLVEQLGDIPDERAQRALLGRHRRHWSPALADLLYQQVIQLAYADLPRADRLASAASWLAERWLDDYGRAQCLRVVGHVLYVRGNYAQALKHYDGALPLFEKLGREVDVGRTLNGSIQTLIYLGRYDDAFARAQKAKRIFQKHNDRLRLARLDNNFGNILYRLDRFDEAIEHYQRAYAELREIGDSQDIAVCLSNLPVCYIGLNDFPRALRTYQEARDYCVQQHQPLMVAQIDYNIAYLHYLRGEYTRAIELYQETRKHCEQLGDTYHMALCDLDQAEMYLELNLSEEGAQLARQAARSFEQLGIAYEAAKATAFLAIASSHQGANTQALALFDEARERFRRESNPVWPPLIDLYKALILFQQGHYAESRTLCEAAYDFFSRSYLTGKAILCELLLARLHLQENKFDSARQNCLKALEKLQEVESPALNYLAYYVLGQAQEALGDREAALEAYQKAHASLERLRSHLRGEELKIAFLQDKLAVYESLVSLNLAGKPKTANLHLAFHYIEQAKSRSLADLIAFRAQTLPASSRNTDLVDRMRSLREELNWRYRQIDLQEKRQEQHTRERLQRLRQHTRQQESQLLQVLSDLRATDLEFSSLQNGGTVELDEIRSVLPADALLLEYYQARGRFYVCLLSREKLEIVPLGPAARVHEQFRLLQFQFAKFRLGTDYTRMFADRLSEATRHHLHALYTDLVAPVRDRLQARHLIIVPHTFLHYVPFQALYDGERYLMDDYFISYAPSGSVYYLCATKQTNGHDRSLILGVPDPLTPYIEEEVESVAAILPHSVSFLGKEASDECLRTYGPTSRFVHIATHGLFRQDNPMFSSIQLGNTRLSLFDLYELKLSAELVTLSGCGTGLNVIVGGDELLGLVRGLFYAGAQAVLVSLWDVNDKSTAGFMKSFYQHLLETNNKAEAIQQAMCEIREISPHPYFWAPFVLIGKYTI